MLLASLALIFLTIFIISCTNRDGDDRGSNSSSGKNGAWRSLRSVLIGFGFYPNYDSHYQQRRRTKPAGLFEAIFLLVWRWQS